MIGKLVDWLARRKYPPVSEEQIRREVEERHKIAGRRTAVRVAGLPPDWIAEPNKQPHE